MTDADVVMDLSQISGSDYADTTKELLELVQKLTAIGAHAVLEIPRVVVIGNQSVGKSSLVEAISGITVPRDSGTCTRCPMECRMKHSKRSWSCQVSIRWEFDGDGQRKKQVLEVPFGDLITDPKDVELALRRAQFAVLHEDIEAKKVLGMSREALSTGVAGSRSLPFSRNVVCVELEGPDLTDLSFIDLPGLIQNEEDRLVKLVETLVVDHIQGNSLILVTVPMTDDLENQKALTLAREADPDGKRTIGVLTKPDVISKGSRSRDLWIEVIEGRKRPLLHGYFCTRQPDDDERERGITGFEARKAEMTYFENTAPWKNSVAKAQFGIKSLAKTLSPLLAQIIRDTLPKISQKAAVSLDSCTEELRKLPEPIKEDSREHMRNLITLLYERFNDYAKGNQGSEHLIQTSREFYTQFKWNIRSTAPNYVPFLKTDKNSAFAQKTIDAELQDSGDESEDETLEPSRIINPPIYLNEVRSRIKGSITRELPNNVPFPAKVTLILAFRERWPVLAKECFDQVRDAALGVLLQQVADLFGRWEYLHVQIRMYITNLVKQHYEKCQSFIDGVLQLDFTPYTQNTHYFESCRDKWLSRYRSMRGKRLATTTQQLPPAQKSSTAPGSFLFGKPAPSAFDFPSSTPPTASPATFNLPHSSSTSVSGVSAAAANGLSEQETVIHSRILSDLASIGYTGLTAVDLERLIKADEYDTEMQVMAEVRSYFQVAYKRIIDLVPAFIDSIFIQGIPVDMRTYLREQLQLGAEDASGRCNRYFAEDPSMTAKREVLMARKATLENVKDALGSFGFRKPYTSDRAAQ